MIITREMYTFYSKLYNEVINRIGIEPDKYEREDAFFGILKGVEDNINLKVVFREVFDEVHGYNLSEKMFNSCYANMLGFKLRSEVIV